MGGTHLGVRERSASGPMTAPDRSGTIVGAPPRLPRLLPRGGPDAASWNAVKAREDPGYPCSQGLRTWRLNTIRMSQLSARRSGRWHGDADRTWAGAPRQEAGQGVDLELGARLAAGM